MVLSPCQTPSYHQLNDQHDHLWLQLQVNIVEVVTDDGDQHDSGVGVVDLDQRYLAGPAEAVELVVVVVVGD